MMKVMRSYRDAGLHSLAVFALGMLIGWLWSVSCPTSVPEFAPWLQVASAFFFLWSVLGVLGWRIQTYGGQSRAERWNFRAFRLLNCLGMFLLWVSSCALLLLPE